MNVDGDFMDIDFNKIKAGIGFPTMVGIVLLIVVHVFLIALNILMARYAPSDYLQLVSLVSIFVLLFALLPFFLWVGYRTAKRYRANTVEAGITTAIVAAIIIIVKYTFYVIAIIAAMVLGGWIPAIGSALSVISMLRWTQFEAHDPITVALNCTVCLAEIFVSLGVNFIVGGIGGYYCEKDRAK